MPYKDQRAMKIFFLISRKEYADSQIKSKLRNGIMAELCSMLHTEDAQEAYQFTLPLQS